MEVRIEQSRKKLLMGEFEKPYFSTIKEKLLEEREKFAIYPATKNWFAAFDMTPFDDVRVVLLWQDPYHWEWQAMWLSFSVPVWVQLPPSLKNIYKEIHNDIGASIATTGDLSSWAKQGVLLLNSFLTVRAGQPASHQWVGRDIFTDAVIRTVSKKKDHVVFLLWWNFAKSKKTLIDTTKHLVLEAAHPSPFSAHSGFFGCAHFSKTNEYLQAKGELPIDWSIA